MNAIDASCGEFVNFKEASSDVSELEWKRRISEQIDVFYSVI